MTDQSPLPIYFNWGLRERNLYNNFTQKLVGNGGPPPWYHHDRRYAPGSSSRRVVGGDNSNDYSSEPDSKSDSCETGLVPSFVNSFLSKDAAMGMILSAANVRGWTTGSGMEGPSMPIGSNLASGTENVSTFPWSLYTRSTRRQMRVAFTCNVCAQRTTRAINPHAYTDGTVFVQCCGCNIYHKLVDNLNLFHEMKCYVNSNFNPNPNDGMNYNLFDLDEHTNEDDTSPPCER